MNATPNTPNTPPEQQEIESAIRTIQATYQSQRAQLEQSLSALDAAHAEWLSLDDGKKLVRLKILKELRKQGVVETVYSEEVKSTERKLIADWDRRADESRKILKSMGPMP